ncbi:MAG: hydroxymethylbilane synthase [Candidatus Dormibacteraeota bacterium]|nr:hydroxymethylbilane synthase [Candidatus Dormibacteraeota bacterium]
MRRLRLGTRASRLALIQSELVAARLRSLGADVELVEVVTEGDLRPGGMSAGEGVFVAALEQQLAEGHVDLAVHSAKDVPLRLHPDLLIGAYPERADARDVLVTRSGGGSLESLASGSVVGTDSPRRAGFVLNLRPDLRHRPLHGNVDTRLRKLDGGEADALVLAAAGLERLGSTARIDARLDAALVPPAPGQGALAVQCRAADSKVRELLARIDRADVRLAVNAERWVLEATGGTCRSPVGALAAVSDGRLRLLAGAAAPDGSARHTVALESAATEEAGARLAGQAAAELLRHVALPV